MKPFRFLLAVALLAAAVGALAAPASGLLRLDIRTLGGGHFDLAAQRGKWVILNQWATWCPPCLREMPALSAYVEAHAAHVAALGLAYDGVTEQEFAAFMHAHPVSYPVVLVDLEHPPTVLPEPEGLPSTYLVGPDGRLVEHFEGPVDAARLDAAIVAARRLHPGWPAP